MNILHASKSGQSLLYYDIIRENLYHPDLGDYHTYGIRVTTLECTDIFHDVSVCKKTVESIVAHLNNFNVSPIHLYDVITDMLP